MDRNSKIAKKSIDKYVSLSARRAWIEIDMEGKLDADLWVALRKESVDRNLMCLVTFGAFMRSLSARRAWIEIYLCRKSEKQDRRRSPQGERG